jgi:hypothetical protein
MSIHAPDHLLLFERANSLDTSALDACTNTYDFLKYKPIKKRTKKNDLDSKEKMKQKIYILSKKV